MKLGEGGRNPRGGSRRGLRDHIINLIPIKPPADAKRKQETSLTRHYLRSVVSDAQTISMTRGSCQPGSIRNDEDQVHARGLDIQQAKQ